jgi:hypothetical protein
MPAVSQERRLWTILAQASEQEWQPIQRSIREAVKIFTRSSMLAGYVSIHTNDRVFRSGHTQDRTSKDPAGSELVDELPVGFLRLEQPAVRNPGRKTSARW